MISFDKCPVCNSRALYEFQFGNTPLLRCKDCTLVFNKEFPDPDDVGQYYANTYKIDGGKQAGSEKRRLFRLPEQISLIAEIMEFAGNESSILDIGCDRGYFLDEARRYGFNTTGVEPSESARAYCKRIGLNVAESIDKLEGQFDIMTLWHVLEHFMNPLESLSEIKAKMKDGGYIFIRVPAFDSFWPKVLKSRWIWFQPRNHLYHYGRASLSRLLTEAGFELLRLEYRKPNNRLTKKMNRLANSTFSVTFNIAPSPRDRIRRLYEDITGVELFAVARKK